MRLKSGRVNMVPPPSDRKVAPRDLLSPGAQHLAMLGTLTRGDLATGRGLTYEWEFFIDALFRQLADVGAGPQTFEFDQSAPASVWTIDHFLSAYPTVLIVDGSGQELIAEVHYPDDQKVVIVHGQPYSGTAFLRI